MHICGVGSAKAGVGCRVGECCGLGRGGGKERRAGGMYIVYFGGGDGGFELWWLLE